MNECRLSPRICFSSRFTPAFLSKPLGTMLFLGTCLGLSGPRQANAQAFDYAAITAPILGATFSVDFAGMQADPYIGTTQVNSVQLWNPANMTSLDLTSAFFGSAQWPNPPQINQGAQQTGFVSANIPSSFYSVLQGGQVGLTALFTDTSDGWFAIDTIELNITTSAGTSSYWYGSPPDGFGIGIPVGGNLPGPLPDSLPFTGTGFDEAISSKSINVIPEPGMIALLILGCAALLVARRWGSWRIASMALLLAAVGMANSQPATPDPNAALRQAAQAPAPKTSNTDELGREFVPGEVLAVFKTGVADQAKRDSAKRAHTHIIKEYSAVRVHHLHIEKGQTVLAAVRTLKADPAVLAASPNYIRHIQDNPELVTPNDPSYPMQWSLNNNGRAPIQIPSILHADPNNNGAFDNGEAIYNDVDGNGVVSAGDILISGAAQANGTALTPFVPGAVLFYVDANNNGFYDAGEAVYNDVNKNGSVNAGDIRVVPAAGSGLAAGVVAAGDADIGTPLNQIFLLSEMYNDANNNGTYDAGETIYWHIYNGSTVKVGDLRRTAFGALAPGEVKAGDADVCRPLSYFRNGDAKPIIDADIDAPQGWKFGTDCSTSICAVIDTGFDVNHPDLAANMWVGPFGINGQSFSGLEAHDETVMADGIFENGEGIYLDNDGSGNVSTGDTRLSPVAAGGAGTIVGACGNADFGRKLVPFVTGQVARHELHTEQIAVDGRFNIGEYVYNDVDNNQVVSVGDVRLSAVTEGAGNYAVGSVVAAGDTDAVARPVSAFAALERHAENIFVNGRYDNGEFIYKDNDNSMTVSAGDTRLTPVTRVANPPYPAGSVVAAGDDDVSTVANPNPLVAFQANELHDTQAGPGAFTFGDGIYRDLDGSKTITVGDIRITASAGSGLTSGGVVATDNDVLPRVLVPFVNFLPERHTENVAVNGRFDAGEFVYIDIDQNGRVSPGDIRLSAVPGSGAAGSTVAAGNADVGRTLIDFTTAEAHDNSQIANTVSALFFQGDAVYLDNDNSGTVTVGDTRIVPPAGLVAGAVAAGDADIGNRIYVFTVSEAHNDPNVDGFYQSPECVINNRALNGRSSPNDQRMQSATFGGAPAGSFVNAGDADAGLPLIWFYNKNALNERHAENIAVNDRYDNGEFIYNDVDDSMTVSVGDIRLTAVPGSGGVNSVVAAGDPDVGTDLVNFAVNVQDDDIQDNNGHGTAVAGVIGAVGNNGMGIAGVCWKAEIMGVRAGAGSFSDATLMACVDYVAQEKAAGEDIRVVNMSLGGPGYDPALKAAIQTASTTGSGMIFTISAGNEGTDNDPDGQPPQAVYRTGGATVAPGATRITGFGPPSLGLAPGSMVNPGDPDVGSNLVNFLAIEKYNDANGNGRYDVGERVYRDMDGNGVVSVNDYRLASFVSVGQQYAVGLVAAGDPDVGLPLTAFAANEKHIDFGSTPGVTGFFAGSQPDYPATYNLPRIVSVAASDQADNLAKFSNWGTNTVHLAAPGVGILTLRPANTGGGYQYINGTSFSSPLVAGILYHLWTRPGFITDPCDLIISFLMADANGKGFSTAGPHGVDHRFGLRNTVISGGTNHDGRARLDSGDDFGDAPDPSYPTTMQNWGARHEDLGEEWLGRDPALPPQWVYDIPQAPPPPTGSTPEYDAFDSPLWPPDPDGVQNLINMDAADDGVMLLGPFTFSPPGGPPNQATVRVFIDTANNDVIDGAAGRYALAGANPLGVSIDVVGDGVHGPGNNRNLWLNAWFDWNRNGSFDDPGEHVFMLACNPTMFVPAHGAVYDVTFDMPTAPPGASNGPLYARFRLDYGENAGQVIPPNNVTPVLPHNVGPSPAGQVMFWDDPGGLPLPGPIANRWESIPVGNPFIQPGLFLSRGLARYGEVEDYLVSGPTPDQLHLYGPNPNNFVTNVSQSIIAMVENDFVGLEGETVVFTTVIGGIQFTSGALSNNATASTVVTDPSGAADVSFIGTNTGPALIQVTVAGTGLTAYEFVQVQAGSSMGIVSAQSRSVTLQLVGTPGQGYTIERSTDLKTWTPITTVTAPLSGVIQFTDTTAPPDRAFYSAVASP